MKEGKCIAEDTCLLKLKTFDGAECHLNFGVGTKFDFRYVSADKVSLERKNVKIIISKNEFLKLFKII